MSYLFAPFPSNLSEGDGISQYFEFNIFYFYLGFPINKLVIRYICFEEYMEMIKKGEINNLVFPTTCLGGFHKTLVPKPRVEDELCFN